MYQDKLNTFSSAQAITASALSDVIDLTKANQNIGVGENLYIVITCDVDFADSGSDSVLTITLESDDNSSLSSATVEQTLVSALVATGALTAGMAPLIFRISPAVQQRYMALRYTVVSGGNFSAGSLTAFITHDVQLWRAYPKNFNVA